MILKSLRSQLLLWLLAPLAIAGAIDAASTYQSGKDTADLIQDHLLLGSARTIAEQVRVVDGRIEVTIPPAALEMLDSGHEDRVYYRVSALSGRLLSGYYELPLPKTADRPDEWVAFDTVLRESPLRAVAFYQPVFEAPDRGPVVIEVAQTLQATHALARQIWFHAVREQLLMLSLVAILLAIGMRRGFSPLIALRNRMLRREPGAVESIDEREVPDELRPLVAALNEYVARIDRHMMAHSRFIADASHQLRTPLAVLNTQVTYSMRSKDPTAKDEALLAIRNSVQSASRLVNQLLALTETEGGIGAQPDLVRLDVTATLTRVIEDHALLARNKDIDLGFESSEEFHSVLATEHMVSVLASNLLDNALRYTQEGGEVTVAIGHNNLGGVVLSVADNGPGIPESEREKVFARFYRLHGHDLEGCGLGLAIVREIVDACRASITLSSRPSGPGLQVTVSFPPVTPAPARTQSAAFSAPIPRIEQAAT